MSAPNFRLIKLAREFRDMTQSQLSTQSRIAQPRLSRIEAGHADATDVEAEALADSLAVPVSFFAQSATPAAFPLFRKRAIRSARRRATINARLNTAVLIGQRLLDAGIEIERPQRFPEPGDFDPMNP